MKISYKLQFTFIVIALLFVVIGYIEHRYIGKVTDSFGALESRITPSLTVLLETIATTRDANIKAIEYSIHGEPDDRDQSHAALLQLQQNIQQYLQLNDGLLDKQVVNELNTLKNNFINSIYDYLSFSEGPTIKQVFKEEEQLQTDRSNLVKAINDAIQIVPLNLKYELTLIKSEARKVSIKLVEFSLRGIETDRKKALAGIQLLKQNRAKFIRNSQAYPEIHTGINNTVDKYLDTAEYFLQLLSTKQNSVDSIYQKEKEIHETNRQLIQVLYPLISDQYKKQNQLVNSTATQLNWSARLQLYSILIITIIALFSANFLARSIATPLQKLTAASRQIGQGRLDIEISVESSDEIGELASSFQQMTKNLKNQTQQIKESEEKFSKAFFDHPVAMEIIDMDSGDRVEFNNRYCELTGYTRDELKDSNIYQNNLWQPTGQQEADQKIKTDGFLSDFPINLRHKSGTLKNTIISATALDIQSKNLMINTLIDVTDRRNAELELEHHRQNLEALVRERTDMVEMQASIIDQTNDAVITVDLDGNIITWNGGAERLFQIPADKALHQPIILVYPENSEQFLQQEIVEPVKAKGMHEIEVRLKKADGSEFPAHLSLSMLYHEDGIPRGIVGYSIDLTEQKKREQELTLLTRQLKDSNNELEAFSYSVSHDLRSPLRSIDGFSLALMEDYSNKLDETALAYLGRVRKAAQRMGSLIDDMLQLSRVNRSDLIITDVDLKPVAEKILDELQTQDPHRQVEVILADEMLVQGDARLLKIIMENLIGNAWKFTARQEKAVITLNNLPDYPNVFYIKDNGVGFDMRHADKLFGVFQRLHQVKDFAGTGVGLATVQRILHRHGGQIWAQSAVDEGATFFFTLKPEVLPQQQKNDS